MNRADILKEYVYNLTYLNPCFPTIFMHLSILCPPGVGINGALERGPFLIGGNLTNLWNSGPGYI